VELPRRSSFSDNDGAVVVAGAAALLVPVLPARVRTRVVARELKRPCEEGRAAEKGSDERRWRQPGLGAAVEEERRWWWWW